MLATLLEGVNNLKFKVIFKNYILITNGGFKAVKLGKNEILNSMMDVLHTFTLISLGRGSGSERRNKSAENINGS